MFSKVPTVGKELTDGEATWPAAFESEPFFVKKIQDVLNYNHIFWLNNTNQNTPHFKCHFIKRLCAH